MKDITLIHLKISSSPIDILRDVEETLCGAQCCMVIESLVDCDVHAHACRGDLLQPSLFPMLLILSRLYPSPLDDADSPMSLKPFVPLLVR